MADPARKPQTTREPRSAREAPPAFPAIPQLRPRALREAEFGPPASNEPHRLQGRLVAAFAARETTPLEKTLMRLIIVAATCVVALSAAGQAGVLGPLFH